MALGVSKWVCFLYIYKEVDSKLVFFYLSLLNNRYNRNSGGGGGVAVNFLSMIGEI